ncbi:MAG: hypothetical protein IB618_04275 [Candidatus Pacearchaeota archaeon]|nr:MAG: hypothetical protein IB618_04275 [Candidatus Pacearchaeota archaeon]
MIIGKRGISHFELITAILIFIFAIAVIVYFINTGMKIDTSQAVLDALEANLKENAEIEYGKILLFADSDANCFNISLHSDLSEDFLTFIKNGDGVAFNFSNGWLLINNTGQNLYKIYFFPVNMTKDIRLEDGECTELTQGQDYNYSIIYRGKIFTEKNLSQLENMDYGNLKSMFNLGNKDFEIRINALDIHIGEKIPPEQVEVQVREIFVDIILEDGTIIKKAKINMKVW